MKKIIKKVKGTKAYNSIDEFNSDFFNEQLKKSTQQFENSDDKNYGTNLAIELLSELKRKIMTTKRI